MKQNMQGLKMLLYGSGILVLILDSKTALEGALDGIELCLRTTIPALFPIMVLASLLCSSLLGQHLPLLTPLCKFCALPKGAVSLLLTGLVGGYPVGAQCIAEAYRDGTISRQEAGRALGFCNNAGPAFVFGIAGTLFSRGYVCWVLWGIHVISAILVGRILPGKRGRRLDLGRSTNLTLYAAVQNSVRSMGYVCGWIVLMRVIIAFLDRWILWIIPGDMRVVVLGALELVNGTCALISLPTEGARFVLCSAMLAFGGACVALQTWTAARSTGFGMYFPGKAMQCIFAAAIAFGVQYFLFPADQILTDPTCFALIIAVCICILLPFLRKYKKGVAFSRNLVYNKEKSSEV